MMLRQRTVPILIHSVEYLPGNLLGNRKPVLIERLFELLKVYACVGPTRLFSELTPAPYEAIWPALEANANRVVEQLQ